MNNTEIKVGDLVLVAANKYTADGYQGDWYVLEVAGCDYGLAKNVFADEPQVWIHRQRVTPA